MAAKCLEPHAGQTNSTLLMANVVLVLLIEAHILILRHAHTVNAGT